MGGQMNLVKANLRIVIVTERMKTQGTSGGNNLHFKVALRYFMTEISAHIYNI